MSHKSLQKFQCLFLGGLSILIVYVVFKYCLPVFLPFVLAYFICRLLYPWAKKLSVKLHIPLGICSTVIVSVFAAVLVLGLGGALWYLAGQLKVVYGSISQKLPMVTVWFEELCGRICELTGGTASEVEQFLCEWGSHFLTFIQENLPQWAAVFMKAAVKTIGAAFIVIVAALVGAVLLMKNKVGISRQIRRNTFACEITTIAERICEVSGGFVRCQAIIIITIAIVLSIGLSLGGYSGSVLIAVIIAVLDALPVVGSGLILVPWALVTWISGSGLKAVLLAGLYIVCTLIREFLEPKLMGGRLGINEFYMFVSAFVGIALFGVWGILLGPLAAVLIPEIFMQMKRW